MVINTFFSSSIAQLITLKYRYPDDMIDRWWWNYTESGWNEISTNSTVEPDDEFKTPSLVLQTAATTSSTKEPLNFNWYSDYKSTEYYFILHFNEIQKSLTGRREFDIVINGIKAYDKPTIPDPSFSLWSSHWRSGFTNYTVSLAATSNSTLPPLLNAFELYKIAPVGVSTYGADGKFFHQSKLIPRTCDNVVVIISISMQLLVGVNTVCNTALLYVSMRKIGERAREERQYLLI